MPFLDSLVTDVLHIHEKRLAATEATSFSAYIAAYPDRAAESLDDYVPLQFPEPGVLPGVQSRTRTILSASGVSFAYPTSPHKVLSDINVKVTLSSRVSVLKWPMNAWIDGVVADNGGVPGVHRGCQRCRQVYVDTAVGGRASSLG